MAICWKLVILVDESIINLVLNMDIFLHKCITSEGLD